MESERKDIFTNRNVLYLAKYICLIVYDILVVYKLDCAFLASNNNNYRKGASGHAICAVTCDGQGYILNSYLPGKIANSNTSENVTETKSNDPIKDCPVYEYDWYKWNKNDFFYIKLGQTLFELEIPDFSVD